MKYYLIFITLVTSLFSYAQPNTDVFLFDLAIENGNLNISNFKNISDNEGYDNQPSFIDNSSLLYAGTRNGQTDIVKYDVETGRRNWISATEGSEYSPLKIPNKNRASAIRLEKDGTQKLYSYNLRKNVSKPLIDAIVIGYHTWFDNNIIVSSVLEDDSLSLYITNINTSKDNKIDANIGRALHKIPNTNLVSYISKKNEKWEIRSLNPVTKETAFITHTLPNSEDICWTVNGTIIMGKDDVLYKFDPKEDKNWVKITPLKKYGVTNITRLATSPNGSKIAIVGEKTTIDPNAVMVPDIDERLAPTLENISWISGNWKGEAFGGITEENWSEPSGGSMMAVFKHIKDNKVTFYEIEIIREVENSLVLQLKHFHHDLKGWETKDETVDFPLKEITANKVVFEGMTFEKISDNEMNIYVDLHQKDGAIEIMKFTYKKVSKSN